MTMPPPRRKLWIGALHVLAVAVLAAAVWPLPPPGFRDCQPVPDAPEYFAGAVAIATAGRHQIEVAGEALPSRYPPAFSATVAVGICAGIEPIRAPFVASALAGLLLLAITGVAVARSAGAAAAGIAAVLLATTPAFVVLARAPLSDAFAAVWTTAAVFAAAAYGRSARLRPGLAAGLLLGVAVCFRWSNLLLCPVIATCWALARRSLARPVRDALLITAAGAIGALPVLWSQWVHFGSPFVTGYSLWAPGRDTIANSFGLAHVADNARYLAREALQLEWKTTVATIYGDGDYISPATLALALLCLPPALRQRTVRAVALGLAPFAAMMLAYFYQDARFFFPLLPPLLAVVAWRCVEVMRGGGRVAKGAVIALLLMHVGGLPGSQPLAGCFSLPPGASHAHRYQAVQRLRAEPPGCVLATFNPPYIAALAGAPWTIAPGLDQHDYQWGPERLRFLRPQRDALVQQWLAAGRPLYLLAHKNLAAATAANPPPVGYVWEQVAELADGGGIVRLRRE